MTVRIRPVMTILLLHLSPGTGGHVQRHGGSGRQYADRENSRTLQEVFLSFTQATGQLYQRLPRQAASEC